MAPVSPPRMLHRRTVVSARTPGEQPAALSTASSVGSARSPAPGPAEVAVVQSRIMPRHSSNYVCCL